MLIIKVDNSGNIEKALKELKNKVYRTKQSLLLRERKEFTKKSVLRRSMINKAKYIQKLKTID